MPSRIGFDGNRENSCYQTASFVSLFLFPSPHIKRLLNTRTARLRNRSTAENSARRFLINEIDKIKDGQQISVEGFLRLRNFLKDVPYAKEFSTSSQNDAAEWLEAMLQVLGQSSLICLSPNNQKSLILNLPIQANQSIQSAFEQSETHFSTPPPLLLINLQRPIKTTKLGSVVSRNDPVRIDPWIKISVGPKTIEFSLSSAIVMNPARNHYSAYVQRPDDKQWFFLSDINGLCQQLSPKFQEGILNSSSLKHQSLRRNAHLLIYVPVE